MGTAKSKPLDPDWKRDQNVLVLQGGGALGAYQAGVYEEVATTAVQPTWVAGVSIGAINAALIVGNPSERRVERLHQFWDLVSSGLAVSTPPWDVMRPSFNRMSASVTATMGVPGFFTPRPSSAFLRVEGASGPRSFYDTRPLRETLLKLVDFDLINSKKVRLSVGAVNVATGNSRYFDNFSEAIGPEHIMASGALPPAFEPVEIDGELYWDGGLVSNTPLQYVLDTRGEQSLLVLQVDLFSASGNVPDNLSAVMARQKDITYSSRTRYSSDMVAKIQNAREQVRRLLTQLPQNIRDTPGVRSLRALVHSWPVDIVQLVYRQKPHELESKDYEFSRISVLDHWRVGRHDMRQALDHPEWLERTGLDDGVSQYDLSEPVRRNRKNE